MRVGVVAPCSPAAEPSAAERGVQWLQQEGFSVEVAPHASEVRGYLAGDDESRADDLLTMLERPDIDAVICLEGGCGALRTVMAMDPARLLRLRTAPPKIFVGYSAVTVLHAVLERSAGWVTFYGPTVAALGRASDYTLAGYRSALMSCDPFVVKPDPDDSFVECLVPGRAAGPLTGGCLDLMARMVGTAWQLELAGRLVFFEDVNSEPYEIEERISQLIMGGGLARAAGIIVGEHAGCIPQAPGPTLSLVEVFHDLLKPLGVPTIYHLPIGHGRHLATLPRGALAELDAEAGLLEVVKSGVQ
jgi:muramoyltetrapeptide carboxypeptidase